VIDASATAGVQARRQVFVVSLGGFDTHDNQNRNHADLMAELARALRYFDSTLGAKNANNNNFDSSPNQVGNGALLPETSVDQLGATLGRWFGLSDGQLLDLFPNLANYNAGQRNLGFMT
jgi:hypothetical protein